MTQGEDEVEGNKRELRVSSDEQGQILLTAEVLGPVEPFHSFRVTRRGGEFILSPEPDEAGERPAPLAPRRNRTPEERVAALAAHQTRVATRAALSDEAMARSAIYD